MRQLPIQTDFSSNGSSSPGLSPILGLPGIVMPNLDNVDETVQRFFYQIVEHLNTMQMWQSTASASNQSYSATPEPSIKEVPGVTLSPRLGPQGPSKVIADQATTPSPHSSPCKADLDSDEIRFQDATEESSTASPNSTTTDFDARGLGISDDHQETSRIPPVMHSLFQQKQLCPPPPGRAYSKGRYDAARRISAADKRSHTNMHNKENLSTRKDIVEPQSVQLRKKSSLRSSEGKKRALNDKHVQILLPSQDNAKEPKSKPTGSLPTKSGAFPLPSNLIPIAFICHLSGNFACFIRRLIFPTFWDNPEKELVRKLVQV
jgi:hypothetical protein